MKPFENYPGIFSFDTSISIRNIILDTRDGIMTVGVSSYLSSLNMSLYTFIVNINIL